MIQVEASPAGAALMDPPAPLLRVLQINDLHVSSGPQDPEGARAKFLALLEGLETEQLAPRPDLILVLGDLVQDPDEALLREVVEPLRRLAGVAVLPVPGNHDLGSPHVECRPWEAVFGTGSLNYEFETHGVLFIVLNNAFGDTEPAEGARKRRNRWLEQVLQQHPGVPKVIACHVPLVPMREPQVLRDSFAFPTWVNQDPDKRLLGILSAHADSIVAVLSAHLHLTSHVFAEGLNFIVPSGLSSWPCHATSYEFFPDRVHVRMIGPGEPIASSGFLACPLHNGIHDRHGRTVEFTDGEHPTFATYLAGTPEEQDFYLPMPKKFRGGIQTV